MCGICGLVSSTALTQAQRQKTRLINGFLAHRGPNGEGYFNADHCALGMRRLSIIDLAGSWQPLYNEDRAIAVICNGEIYNYLELRRELIAKGHQFSTEGDVETIVHLYEDYGEDFVHALRGMFAIALWDARAERLILARDRMGEKPLYLYMDEQSLYFASEMTALLQSRVAKFDLNPDAVNLYFHYNYVPEPATPVKSIHKLDAAHMLIVDVKDWHLRDVCYWRMEDAPPLEGDAIEDIRAELDHISALILRSDVPIGLSLSGGLDSSLIAALTTKKYPDVMNAFSVGYATAHKHDEREPARELAKQLGMPFHEIEITTDEMVSVFPEVVRRRDDPIADISGYSYYIIMQKTKEAGIPVLLQGHGGDELFWGYKWVQEAVEDTLLKQQIVTGQLDLWKQRAAALPYLAPITTTPFSGQALKDTAKTLLGHPTPTAERWRRLMSKDQSAVVFMDAFIGFQLAEQKHKQAYTQQFASQLTSSPYDFFSFEHPWNDVPVLMTRLISDSYLRQVGLAQGDRLSMAHSVELRVPLVDYRFFETVIGHRKTKPDHHLPGKSLLREAAKTILPEWVLNRPKTGFSAPRNVWYTALFERYGDQLRDGYLVQNKILEPGVVNQMVDGMWLFDYAASFPFKALVLELWCRNFQ